MDKEKNEAIEDLFDAARSRELRDLGMAKSLEDFASSEWVLRARAKAIEIAIAKGTVTINDVHQEFPPPRGVRQNAIGSVLRSRNLKRVSDIQSDKKSSHARRIGVYIYVKTEGI